MAIELCSDDNSAGISTPRISFSYDFCLSDNVPVDTTVVASNSSIDFDFCVRKSSFDQESSPADELFSDGKILPAEIKKRNAIKTPINPSPDPYISSGNDSKKEIIKSGIIDQETEEKANTKSFWRFKRSSSLNCVSGYGRSLCPLPLLSRSNSTGSAPNTLKRVPFGIKESNNNNNNATNKHSKQPFLKQSSSSSNNYQKPPLKKNYGNRVRVSPVLNVPSGNLFGIFFNAKDKNRKK